MTRRGRIFAAAGAVLAMVLGAPTPAKADPITAAIVTAIGFTGTAAAVATFVINGLFTVAVSWASSKLMGRSRASVAEMAERQASVTTLSLGEVPRELLIGEVCTGGSLIDAFNHGGGYGTDWVTRCVALADHQVEGLVGFFVDDKFYPFTTNGLQPDFSGALDMEFVQASSAGAAPPARFLAASGGTWASTDVLASITHVWFSYKYNDQVWTQGHPQLRFVLRGLKAYDPRKDAALGYVGPSPQTWSDPSTHTWTRNAALLRYAFARGIYAVGQQGTAQHLLIGRGLSAVEAPPERIIAAANLCDELVDDVARYTANGVIRASDDFIAVEEMFAAAMAGVIVQREGGVEIEPGQAKAAVVTITDSDLVVGEPVTFSEFLSDGDGGRVNSVVPRYVDPTQNWKDHSGPVRRELADITADRGPREITLPLMLVTEGGQADRCAEIARKLGRLERTATIVLPPEYGRLEEGDWIAWTSARRHGGATVRYRIETWALDGKWRMRLSLREIASSVYGEPDPVEDLADVPPAPPSIDPLALTGVTATVITLTGTASSTPALRFTWAVPDPAVIAIRAEVRRVGETQAAAARTEDVAGLSMIVTNGVGPDQALQARLVPITSLTRPVVASPWIDVTSADLIAGDVAPITPGTVSGTPTLSLSTTIMPDGSQVSRLSGGWTAPMNAVTYLVELDNGTVTPQFVSPTNAIADRIVSTGPTYRYRVKGVSRTNTPSAAWSSWSASVAAGGDTTAPGVASGFSLTPLALRIVLNWTPPVDKDYAGLQVYRNTAGTAPVGGTAPTYGATAPLAGTVFADTSVAAGTLYYYWCRTVDRSGNIGAYVSMGSQTPRYIKLGNGDVEATDAALVTALGTALNTSNVGTRPAVDLETITTGDGVGLVLYQSGSDTSSIVAGLYTRTSGSSNFNQMAISRQVIKGPAQVSGRLLNALTGFGFTRLSALSTDANTSCLAHWYTTGSIWLCKDGNTNLLNCGAAYNGVTFSTATVFDITDDGITQRWWADGVEMYSRPTPSGSFTRRAAAYAYSAARSVGSITLAPFNNAQWSVVSGTGRPDDNASRADNLLLNATFERGLENYKQSGAGVITLNGRWARNTGTSGAPAFYFNTNEADSVSVLNAMWPKVPDGGKIYLSYDKKADGDRTTHLIVQWFSEAGVAHGTDYIVGSQAANTGGATVRTRTTLTAPTGFPHARTRLGYAAPYGGTYSEVSNFRAALTEEQADVTGTNTAAAIVGQAPTATSSDFSAITGATKPSNNATVGADWTANLANRPSNIAALSGSEGIQNNAISINAAGVLSGAGGGTVLLTNLGGTIGTTQIGTAVVVAANLANNAVDLAGSKVTGKSLANVDSTANTKLSGIATGATVGATWGTDLTGRPANIAALVGSEGIKNTDVSINAAGVLSGAGGGTVLLTNLGGTIGTAQVGSGAITTAKIAAAAITGTELATNAVDLAGSKVTGKSLANVDSTANTKLSGIATGATVGAISGANIRDSLGALVLESRIINDLGPSGGVVVGGIKQFSNGQSSPMGAQPLVIEATDGQVITFATPYAVTPSIIPLNENLDGLAAGEYYRNSPVSPSGSGFTARARRVNPGSSPVYTTRLDDGGTGTIETGLLAATRQKALSGVAYNEAYIATVNLSLKGAVVDYDNSGGAPVPIYGSVPVTVSLYGRQTLGGAWVLAGSTTVNSPNSNTATAVTVVIDGSLSWATWNVHADPEYRVVITQNGNTAQRYITSFVSVSWEEQTGGGSPSDVTALSGGRKIKYQITPLDG